MSGVVLTDLRAEWGQRLRTRRVGLRLSQSELAAICSVSVSTVSRVEAGLVSPTDDLKWRLAGALAMRMDRLWAWPAVVPPLPEAAERPLYLARLARAAQHQAEPPGPGAKGDDEAAVVTVAQLARLLGVHRTTLYGQIEAGDFPLKPLDLPGRMRFSRAEVERLLGRGPGSSATPDG